jgi:hypothetical protein
MTTLAVSGAIVVAVIVAAVVLVVASRGGGSHQSALDSELRNTVSVMLPVLNRPGKLPVTDPTFHSFQAWELNIRSNLVRAVLNVRKPDFSQVVVLDPSTMPPTDIGLNQPGHPIFGVKASMLKTAFSSSNIVCDTVTQTDGKYRACIAALQTPAPLKPSGSNAILEVFRRTGA